MELCTQYQTYVNGSGKKKKKKHKKNFILQVKRCESSKLHLQYQAKLNVLHMHRILNAPILFY